MDVRVLGPLEVLDGGRSLPLGPPQQRAVLAVLLIHLGEVVATDVIVDAVWGERPPATAANLVQGYVSGLRKALGRDTIVTGSVGYVLQVPPEEVDARRFEQILATARLQDDPETTAAALRGALELWRGPAFVDFATDEFAQPEIRRLEALREVAREERIDADLACGRHAEVVPELEVMVEEQPLREHAWWQLALAHYRCGRQADALETCRRARTVLHEELGVDPGVELRELEQAILNQDPSLDPTVAREPTSNLPSPLTRFLGRERELDELAGLLRASRLVTLIGPGGCGKTRLAIEAAARTASRWSDGVWFIDLAPVSEPALVPHTIGQTLGLPGGSDRSVEEQISSYLGRREVLLVVDNCEHVVDACGAVLARLLEACPRLALLATSREILAIPGEATWPVPPMRLPAEGDHRAVDFLSHDAVRLFVERAALAHPGTSLEPDDLETVASICRRLDGIPLAIELAAARARSMSPAQVADRLDDLLDVLASSRAAASRHRTMRATLDWSYDLLDEGERALFRYLAVFVGGFPLEGAEAMTAVVGASAGPKGAPVLAALVDKSLVVRGQGADGEPRYRMLEVVRQYAHERLEQAGEVRAAKGGLVAYLKDLARRRHDELYRFEQLGPSSPRWPNRVEEERDNLRSALTWCFSSGAEPDAGEILIGTGLLWFFRGPASEGRRWHERALPHARSDFVRAWLSLNLGQLAMVEGDFRRTRTLASQALGLADALGDELVRVQATGQFGWAAWASGDLAAAERYLAEALDQAEALGNRWDASTWRALLARLISDLGDLTRAAELADRAVRESREFEEPFHRGVALDVRARIAQRAGDLDLAYELAQESLASYRAFGYREGMASALATLASVALERGDSSAAAGAYGEALDLAHRLGHRDGAISAIEGLGRVAASSGEDSAAVRLLAAATTLRQRPDAGIPGLEERLTHELDAVCGRLGHAMFDELWNSAAALDFEDATERAMRIASKIQSRDVAESPDLTRR